MTGHLPPPLHQEEALTEIIQQHTGCYSDDRPRERCLVHGTDWPCEQLGAFVAEVWSWYEANSPVDDPEDDDDSLGFAAREEVARARYDLTPEATFRAALARRIDHDIIGRDHP